MNVILIGPVSGNIELAKHVFRAVETACIKTGNVVVQNPMRDHVGGKSEAEYMQESLSRICQLVIDETPDLAAILLPGWENSDGATCEAALCRKLGIRVFTWNCFLPPILSFAVASVATGFMVPDGSWAIQEDARNTTSTNETK